MARIRSLAVGKARGSMGNLTYRIVRGQTIASEKIVENKSSSPAQVAQRGKFSILANTFKQNQFAFKFDFPRTQRGSTWNNLVKLMAPQMFTFLESNPSLVAMANAGRPNDAVVKLLKNMEAAESGVVGLTPRFSTFNAAEKKIVLDLDNDSGINIPTFDVGPDLVGKRLFYTLIRYCVITPFDVDPAEGIVPYPISSYASGYVDLVAANNTFDWSEADAQETAWGVLGTVRGYFGLISCYYEEDGVRTYVGTSYYGRVRP